MRRTKKIYKYANQMIKRCIRCKGRGWVNFFGGQACDWCNGTGGEFKQVRFLVGEEVTQ